MSNHFICVSLKRLFRSACASIIWGSSDSELRKPILNTGSETENSELDKSEFGSPRVLFLTLSLVNPLCEMGPWLVLLYSGHGSVSCAAAAFEANIMSLISGWVSQAPVATIFTFQSFPVCLCESLTCVSEGRQWITPSGS